MYVYVPGATSFLPCQRHCIVIELNFLASELHSNFFGSKQQDMQNSKSIEGHLATLAKEKKVFYWLKRIFKLERVKFEGGTGTPKRTSNDLKGCKSHLAQNTKLGLYPKILTFRQWPTKTMQHLNLP